MTSLLVGCGKGSGKSANGKESSVKVEEKGFPIVKEKLEMTMMAPGTGLAEWKNMPMLKDYSEKTGINFKYTTPPLSDFQTKLNLAFASGDLADIIYAAGGSLGSSMEVDYGSQGILLPLEDLIPKYAPNLNKLMEEDPSIRKSITTPDGHIYSLPVVSRGDTAIWPRGPLWYNGEWLKKLGVKELPKTTDEFYDLLVRFRDEDPNGNGKKDDIPLTDTKLDNSRDWLMAAFGMKSQGIEEINGKVRYPPVTENYKAYLTYMHKLYAEGLLDKEVYSQADEQRKAKGQNNQIGLFPDWFSYFTTGQNETEALDNPMFQPLTSEVSKKAVVPGSPRLVRGAFALTEKNPSPEASLRWIDYFYSDEGYTYLNQGPEGSFWEYKENKDGKKVKVYTKDVDLTNTEDSRGKVSPDYGITAPTKSVTIPAIKEKVDDPDIKPFDEFVKNETKNKITKYAETPFPLVYLTKEQQDQVSTVRTDLQTYVEQMEAKFITGVEPLENWDKFVSTINSMGVDDYVKVYQEAYDTWKAAE
nr:extracellular solute-binding protein [Vagococcus proximus]